MNNMNVFQKRALQKDTEKFSNSIPKQDVVNPTQDMVVEEEISEPKKNIFQNHAEKNTQKKQDKFGFLDTAKDVSQQIVSKGISGFGGAYGNVLDTFGLQTKPGQVLEGQKAISDIQGGILDKLNKGEIPSFSELMLLSDDDLLPSSSRLPTSKDIQSGIKDLTGIGEGKTPAGRIAGRGAEFLGEGLAYPTSGAKSLLTLAGAGSAGQGIREAGGPESLATGTEIIGSIIPSAIQGRVNPRNARDRRFVNAARNMGFNEREITPLIQGPKKVSTLKPLARKGTKTKELFENISNGAGQIYDQIRQMPNAQVPIPVQSRNRLNTAFQNIRNNLSNTLQPSPDKQSAINFIDGAIAELQSNGANPERLINFWQDINSAVNWNSIRGGRKQLSALKEPISDALQSVSPQINQYFTDINELYSRYKNISKKLKPDLVDSFFNKGEIATALPSALALVYGNPTPLMSLGGEVATRLLAREMLINPYFQNIANKLVTNFNSGSVKGITELVKQTKDYMTRKHPEQDWSFLTDPIEEEN